jgi:hypothetical protein
MTEFVLRTGAGVCRTVVKDYPETKENVASTQCKIKGFRPYDLS